VRKKTPHQGGVASVHLGRSEFEPFHTGMKTKEWKSFSALFFKHRQAEKLSSHLLSFGKTKDADFPSTKYFTVRSIFF